MLRRCGRLLVLKHHCRLPLDKHHAGGQGEVINDVLKGRAHIGLVDEDPGRTRHRDRELMPVVRRSDFLELRSHDDRHVVIVKEDLEHSFLRSMNVAKLDSSLPKEPSALHRTLSIPGAKGHEVFKDDLGRLLRHSKETGIRTLAGDLEEMVRSIV